MGFLLILVLRRNGAIALSKDGDPVSLTDADIETTDDDFAVISLGSSGNISITPNTAITTNMINHEVFDTIEIPMKVILQGNTIGTFTIRYDITDVDEPPYFEEGAPTVIVLTKKTGLGRYDYAVQWSNPDDLAVLFTHNVNAVVPTGAVVPAGAIGFTPGSAEFIIYTGSIDPGIYTLELDMSPLIGLITNTNNYLLIINSNAGGSVALGTQDEYDTTVAENHGNQTSFYTAPISLHSNLMALLDADGADLIIDYNIAVEKITPVPADTDNTDYATYFSQDVEGSVEIYFSQVGANNIAAGDVYRLTLEARLSGDYIGLLGSFIVNITVTAAPDDEE